MRNQGFTLIELVTVMILVGIVSVVLLSRISSTGAAAVQSGRDDLIAALFFAQQQAMMRSNISVVLTANSVSVNENNNPIAVSNDFYPLTMPAGVSLPALTLNYDKLGRTTATQIVLTGSGNSSGVTATIQVDASGYAYAQ
ncbi:pilus assembly FimT family protein [Cellvibrio fibrivorans]|uniref:MSHA pilin protein MshC n=1 Tax=Cellvibrio fibrivorans TaxID=126350 RepID=A0ABU1UY70_9GAMM|nr:type II secretion system protein [Cellvibrio fibrivorans]MDR7090144.1 MSHA pilin protein MshC [Cellvibrio fibrivorans]